MSWLISQDLWCWVLSQWSFQSSLVKIVAKTFIDRVGSWDIWKQSITLFWGVNREKKKQMGDYDGNSTKGWRGPASFYHFHFTFGCFLYHQILTFQLLIHVWIKPHQYNCEVSWIVNLLYLSIYIIRYIQDIVIAYKDTQMTKCILFLSFFLSAEIKWKDINIFLATRSVG